MPIMIKKSAPRIESLSDLFELLGKSQPGNGYVNLYRGHPDKIYKLQRLPPARAALLD
jgi:hypothetical protein